MTQAQRQQANQAAQGARRAVLGTGVAFGVFGRIGSAQAMLAQWQAAGQPVTAQTVDPETGAQLFRLDSSELDGPSVMA